MINDKSTRYLRYVITLAVLIIVFVILILLNIKSGSVNVSVSDILKILFGETGNTTDYSIIWKVRLPRIAACIILGGALALSGFLLQTFFNNPIAGPYVLGISSGSKMMVAVAMILILSKYRAVSSGILIAAAFAGAMLSMGFVLIISKRVQKASMLIVCGVMIGYICSAITDIMITFADDANIVNLHNWSMGSFSGTSWTDVRIMAAVVIPSSVAVFLMSKFIGAYQLGESYAQNMGVNVKLFRIAIVLLSSFLCACVTSFAGPISFVGIAVPHLVKSFLKTSRPLMVTPVCFLGGSVFCLGCDLIARTLFAPVELSVSSVSSVFGVPIVIYIMMKKRVQ